MYQLIRETRYYTQLDFVKRCQTNLSMQRYVFIVRETISFRLILLFPLWNHQHHSLLNSFLKFAQLQLEALNSNFQQKTDYINLKRVWSFPINWNVLVFQKVFIHVLVVYRRGRQEALREITLFYALDLTHSKLN